MTLRATTCIPPFFLSRYQKDSLEDALDTSNLLLQKEIFGPVLAVVVYPDAEYARFLAIADETSRYGLTASMYRSNRVSLDLQGIDRQYDTL